MGHRKMQTARYPLKIDEARSNQLEAARRLRARQSAMLF